MVLAHTFTGCDSVMFYLIERSAFSDTSRNALPANIRKLVFYEIKRDGISSFHGIHGQLCERCGLKQEAGGRREEGRCGTGAGHASVSSSTQADRSDRITCSQLPQLATHNN